MELADAIQRFERKEREAMTEFLTRLGGGITQPTETYIDLDGKSLVLGKYKVLGELGQGCNAAVYKVEDAHDHSQWALKVERMLEGDRRPDVTKPLWREQGTFEWVATLPAWARRFFSHSREARFVRCKTPLVLDIDKEEKGKPKTTPRWMTPRVRARRKAIAATDHAMARVIDLKDGMLLSLLSLEPPNQRDMYAMIVQVTYALWLMRLSDRHHNDVHANNIMHNKAARATTELRLPHGQLLAVPNHGKEYSLVDYGLATHSSYGAEHHAEDHRDNDDMLSMMGTLMANLQRHEFKAKDTDMEFLPFVRSRLVKENPDVWAAIVVDLGYMQDDGARDQVAFIQGTETEVVDPEKKLLLSVLYKISQLLALHKREWLLEYEGVRQPVPNLVTSFEHLQFAMRHHRDNLKIVHYFAKLLIGD